MAGNSGDKPRLLIVDDSKVIRVTARKILRNHFETVEAVDGENAWEILGSEAPFSLVVSDLTMPNLDGFGLLERIRSSHLPHVSNIPVIIITGSNDSEATKARASKAGATDFIGKPFDSAHLLARTRAHAVAHEAASTLNQENMRLEEQSSADALTGLANEVAFMERGHEQLSYAIRHNSSLSVMRIEIDNYGELFRQHGEPCTQTMVKSVASILSAATRQEDMAARVGTARFALLLQSVDRIGINNLAERIRTEAGKLDVDSSGQQVAATVSIGIVAQAITADTSFTDLLSLADSRLLQAVEQGGNQVSSGNHGLANRNPYDETVFAMETVIETVASDPAPMEYRAKALSLCEPEVPDTGSIPGETGATPIKSLAAGIPEPIPAQFAGPAPDGPAVFAVNDPAPENHAGNGEPPVVQDLDTYEGKARFVLPDEEPDEEEIIITAPYDPYTDNNHEPTGTTEDKQADKTESVAVKDADTIAVIPADETEQETESDRPGFFGRALRSLFGRSSNNH